MLEELGWRTLEQRRNDSPLVALFKITRVLLSVKSQELLRPVTRRSRRSYSESFILLQTSLSSEYLSFFPRTIIQWNNLPASVFSQHCSFTYFQSLCKLFISPLINYLFIHLISFGFADQPSQ